MIKNIMHFDRSFGSENQENELLNQEQLIEGTPTVENEAPVRTPTEASNNFIKDFFNKNKREVSLVVFSIAAATEALQSSIYFAEKNYVGSLVYATAAFVKTAVAGKLLRDSIVSRSQNNKPEK
jgi:hypothetical protein